MTLATLEIKPSQLTATYESEKNLLNTELWDLAEGYVHSVAEMDDIKVQFASEWVAFKSLDGVKTLAAITHSHWLPPTDPSDNFKSRNVVTIYIRDPETDLSLPFAPEEAFLSCNDSGFVGFSDQGANGHYQWKVLQTEPQIDRARQTVQQIVSAFETC